MAVLSDLHRVSIYQGFCLYSDCSLGLAVKCEREIGEGSCYGFVISLFCSFIWLDMNAIDIIFQC